MVLAGVTVEGNGLSVTMSTFVLGDIAGGKQSVPVNKTAEVLCLAHSITKENLGGEYFQRDSALRTFRLLQRRGEESGISFKAGADYSVSSVYGPAKRLNVRRIRSIVFTSQNEISNCSCKGQHTTAGNKQPACWQDGTQFNVSYRRVYFFGLYDDDYVAINEIGTTNILYICLSDILSTPANFPKRLISDCFERWVCSRMAARRPLTEEAKKDVEDFRAGTKLPKSIMEEEEDVEVIDVDGSGDSGDSSDSCGTDDTEELSQSQPIPVHITRH